MANTREERSFMVYGMVGRRRRRYGMEPVFVDPQFDSCFGESTILNKDEIFTAHLRRRDRLCR
jgi:hypothetical protein